MDIVTCKQDLQAKNIIACILLTSSSFLSLITGRESKKEDEEKIEIDTWHEFVYTWEEGFCRRQEKSANISLFGKYSLPTVYTAPCMLRIIQA